MEKIKGNKWEKSLDYGAGNIVSYVHNLSGKQIWPLKTRYDGELLGTKEKPWAVGIGDDDGNSKTYTFRTREEAQAFFNKYKEKVIADENKLAKRVIKSMLDSGRYRNEDY